VQSSIELSFVSSITISINCPHSSDSTLRSRHLSSHSFTLREQHAPSISKIVAPYNTMEALQEYPFPIMNPSLSTSNRNLAHRPPLIKAYATMGLAATSPATSPTQKTALNESRPGFCFAKEEPLRPTASPRPLDPQATSYFPVSSDVKRAPLQVQPNQGAGRRFRRNPNLYDKGALFRGIHMRRCLSTYQSTN